MLLNNSMLEKATAFDRDGQVKREVNKTIGLLKEFRAKFPFAENLREIDQLNPDRLFKVNPDGIGEFFSLLDGYLKELGNSSSINADVCRNARLQLGELKNLLCTVVDGRLSLAHKIDAPWEKIGCVGQDKQLALEIIFSFTCQSNAVLPVFSVQHLRHFANAIANVSIEKTKHLTVGQEYEHHTAELIKTKNNQPLTRSWNVIYFTRFLYITYPPPESEPEEDAPETIKIENAATHEKQDLQGFLKLLGELQKQHKINGVQFRENRELWLSQQPNDREVLVWQLKKLLQSETKTNSEVPKSQPLQKRRL
jgi:hypothetical protein